MPSAHQHGKQASGAEHLAEQLAQQLAQQGSGLCRSNRGSGSGYDLAVAAGETLALIVEVAGDVVEHHLAALAADRSMGAIVGGGENVAADGMGALRAEIMAAGGAGTVHIVAGNIGHNGLAAGLADGSVGAVAVVNKAALGMVAGSGDRHSGQTHDENQNQNSGNHSFHDKNSFEIKFIQRPL